jgi:hypothetical protein
MFNIKSTEKPLTVSFTESHSDFPSERDTRSEDFLTFSSMTTTEICMTKAGKALASWPGKTF